MFQVDGYDVTLHPDVINAGGIENCVRGVVFGEDAEDLLNSFEMLGEYIHIAKFNRAGENYALDIYYSDFPLKDGDPELRFVVQLLSFNGVEIDGELDKDLVEVLHEWSVDEIDQIENEVKNILSRGGL